MAETEEQKKGKKLGLSRPGKLELKKTVATGQVRQNFSHGRSRMVKVEVRKKRTFAPDAGGHMAEIHSENIEAAEGLMVKEEEPAVSREAKEEAPDGAAPHLTEEEKPPAPVRR